MSLKKQSEWVSWKTGFTAEQTNHLIVQIALADINREIYKKY